MALFGESHFFIYNESKVYCEFATWGWKITHKSENSSDGVEIFYKFYSKYLLMLLFNNLNF